MFERVATRVVTLARRLRRFERRELAAFGRWLEHTGNLLHLTVLVAVPLLIGLVTLISNALAELSFLLFPPLASGAYTLFSDPEGRYAAPGKFVIGLTVGALCGLAALRVTGPSGTVSPASAALSILLTGATTWALDVEEPAAFSTALLVLVTDDASPAAYVTSVAAFGTLIAAAFTLWRERFYERRAEYLYDTVRGDDHVLVPMRGDPATVEWTALFGATLAAAHEAGKVVLLGMVEDADAANGDGSGDGDEHGSDSATASDGAGERERVEGSGWAEGGEGIERGTDGSVEDIDAENVAAENVAAEDVEAGNVAAENVAAEDVEAGTVDDPVATAIADVERHAETVRTRVGVPCETVVVDGDPVAATLRATDDANCDLIVTPYESGEGTLSPYVRGLFGSEYDTVAFRPEATAPPPERADRRWRRALVTVSRGGDVAHAMLDFAARLVGPSGFLSVCTCIDSEVERRSAEKRLADLAETVDVDLETRVARSEVTEFVAANADAYDLLVMGSSGDRSRASRFLAPPTFARLREVDCDVAVVDRGRL